MLGLDGEGTVGEADLDRVGGQTGGEFDELQARVGGRELLVQRRRQQEGVAAEIGHPGLAQHVHVGRRVEPGLALPDRVRARRRIMVSRQQVYRQFGMRAEESHHSLDQFVRDLIVLKQIPGDQKCVNPVLLRQFERPFQGLQAGFA